jgi:tetratricopeptide (TPR) repeat protein
MGVTYWPIKEAIDEIVGASTESWTDEITESAGAEEAKRIVEQVSATFGPGQGTGSHDEIRWALRRVLEIRAQQQPVVLVFDDVQWAEPTFVDLIHYITDESTGSPLLLICVGRTEPVDVHSKWSAARGNASVLPLEPLTDADCELMLSNLLEGRDIDGAVRDQIIEAAAGNPLFAEEMLSLLIEQGRLVEEEGRWVAPGGLRRISAPPTIAALISTRLEGLPRPERAVLEGASVVGVTFESDTVEVVSDLSASVASTLDTLVAREFIQVSEPTQDRVAFFFRHALIRDAAYAGMSKDRRARIHVRLADWLTSRERFGGESAELIGYHLEQAFAYRAELGSLGEEGTRLGTRAAAQLWAAGRTALNGRGDLQAAVALFERATPMISEEDAMSIEIRLDQAQALAGLGRLEPAVSIITDTLDRAKQLKGRRLLARAEVRRMLIQGVITTPGWTSEASAVAQRAIRVLERFEDDIGLAEAFVLLASVRWSECRASLTEAALQRAAALYRRAGDRAAELEQVVWIGATAVLGPTPTDQGIERVQRALDQVAGFPRAEASLMTELAHLVAMRGNFDAARTLSADAAKIVDDLGDRARGASLTQTPIWIDLMVGDAATAEARARRAYELLNDLGARSAQGVVGALLARALLELDRFEQAESVAASIEEVRPDDIRTRLTCGTVRARALASLGEVGAGESKARATVRLAKQTDFINEEGDARLDLAAILEIAGQPELAARAVEGSLSCYMRKGNLVSAGRAQQASSRLSKA